MAGKDTTLATTSNGVENYLALSMQTSEIREVLSGVLGSEGLSPKDLERVRLPAGGGISWEINTLDGAQSVQEIQGIIIAQRQVRVYWERSFEESGGNVPPDCFSDDAIVGLGKFKGQECALCPMSEFGSGKGKSQACQLKRIIFFLREDQLLPSYVALPPTSQSEGKAYITRLASNGKAPYHVITGMTLEKAKNEAGITYSKVNFHRVSNLDMTAIKQLGALVAELMPLINSSVRVVAADVDGAVDRDDTTGRAAPVGAYADDVGDEEVI